MDGARSFNVRLSEHLKGLAPCLMIPLLLILVTGCTVERISPGGTIDIQLGDQTYHLWWRVANAAGGQLRYSLLAKATSGTGITSFVLSFVDASMQSLHQTSQTAKDSAAAVFEGVIPDRSTSVQLAVVADEEPACLSFTAHDTLQHALAALRDSQEVAFVVAVMTGEERRELIIRASETAKFIWGSTISLEVALPVSPRPDEDTIDIDAGYYSGFTDSLASWTGETRSSAEDSRRAISVRFQTEDLAYARLSYASGDSFLLTFHVYAPCPFSGS